MQTELHPEVIERFQSEMVSINTIVVGQRFRVDYKNMDELCASIIEHGLIHYPVLDQDNNLVAGGRRLEALRRLGWSNIPVTRLHNISEAKLRELELEENLQRAAMSWQEEIALKEEIVRLKKEIYGEKGTGRAAAANPNGVSNKDIAEMLGESQANLSMDLTLAKAMDTIPQLKECKTKDEARKELKRLQEKLIVEELERRHEASAIAQKEASGVVSAYAIADKLFRIRDAHEGLSELQNDQAIKFINVDTPYGIDLNAIKRTNSESQGIIEHNYLEWDVQDFLSKCRQVIKECHRIAADDCFMTWWFAIQWYQPLLEILQEEGWKVDPIPNLWFAGDQGQTNQPEIYLARSYEPFFVCRKGKPIIMQRGRANVFQHKRVASTSKIHPTEKPIGLMEEVFKTYAAIGSKILVPFLGSGNDILAGLNTGHETFGFDLNNEVKKRFLIRVAEMEVKK